MKYTDLENAIKIYNNFVCNRLKQKNKELNFGVVENSFTEKRITSNIDDKKDDLFKRFSIEELAKKDLEENEEMLITNFCRDFDDFKSPFNEIVFQEKIVSTKKKRYYENARVVFNSIFGKMIKSGDELFVHPVSFKKFQNLEEAEKEELFFNKFDVKKVKNGTWHFSKNLKKLERQEKETLRNFIKNEITAKVIFKIVKSNLTTNEFVKSATNYYFKYKNCESIINLIEDYEKIIDFKNRKELEKKLKIEELENAYSLS